MATEPGTVIVSFSMRSVAPNRCSTAAMRAERFGFGGEKVAMAFAVPKPMSAGAWVFTATAAPTTVAATATSTRRRMRKLLAPFPPEQAPGPANHGAPRRHPAALVGAGAVAHPFGAWARKDSALCTGMV